MPSLLQNLAGVNPAELKGNKPLKFHFCQQASKHQVRGLKSRWSLGCQPLTSQGTPCTVPGAAAPGFPRTAGTGGCEGA